MGIALRYQSAKLDRKEDLIMSLMDSHAASIAAMTAAHKAELKAMNEAILSKVNCVGPPE